MLKRFAIAAAASLALAATLPGCQATDAAGVKSAYVAEIDRLAEIKARAVDIATELQTLIGEYQAQLAALPPGDPAADRIAGLLAEANEALAVVRSKESQADESIDRFRAAIEAIDDGASVTSANIQAGIAAGSAVVPYLPPPWNIVGALVLAIGSGVAGALGKKRPGDVTPTEARKREAEAWDEAYKAGAAAAKGQVP